MELDTSDYKNIESLIESIIERIAGLPEVYTRIRTEDNKSLSIQELVAILGLKLNSLKDMHLVTPKALYIDRAEDILRTFDKIVNSANDMVGLPESSYENLHQITKDILKLRGMVEHLATKGHRPSLLSSQEILDSALSKFEQKANSVVESLEGSEEKYKGLEHKLLKQFISVEDRIKEIEQEHDNALGSIKNLFDANEAALLKKQRDIDMLFGIASGSALAGGYQGRAKTEEDTANYLRYSSLILMVVIVGLFSWSLYETTLDKIDWHILLFKFVVSVMLSVPAAYLARESTRHRLEHQYYLSKALDINAIDPYIANLPDNEQHKLKSKIALRLFAARKETPQESNTFPLNAQELLIKILENAEIKFDSNNEKK